MKKARGLCHFEKVTSWRWDETRVEKPLILVSAIYIDTICPLYNRSPTLCGGIDYSIVSLFSNCKPCPYHCLDSRTSYNDCTTEAALAFV